MRIAKRGTPRICMRRRSDGRTRDRWIRFRNKEPKRLQRALCFRPMQRDARVRSGLCGEGDIFREMQLLERVPKWRDIVRERVEQQRVFESRNNKIRFDPALAIRQERARDTALSEFGDVLRHKSIHKVDPILTCHDERCTLRTIDKRDTRSNRRVLKLDFGVLRNDFAGRRARRICRTKREILNLDFASRDHDTLRSAARRASALCTPSSVLRCERAVFLTKWGIEHHGGDPIPSRRCGPPSRINPIAPHPPE